MFTRSNLTRRDVPRTAMPVLALLLLATCGAAPDKSDNNGPGEPGDAAIRASAEAFTKAFNRGDAKAVAALWTANGTEADESGKVFKGRQAIEGEYAALFKAQPGTQIELAIQSIEFASPGVAIEDGVATLKTKDGSPASASHYTAVHVLEDGQWLMASVRESHLDTPSGSARLQPLEWLVGKWEAKQNDTIVTCEARWIAHKNFIQRDYEARRGGTVISSGTQVIGPDARSGQICSWSFDSSGGHGIGLWSPAPDGWRIESRGGLADGTPTASREIVIRVPGENDIFGWRSIDRRVGPTILPDTQEVVLERVTAKQ